MKKIIYSVLCLVFSFSVLASSHPRFKWKFKTSDIERAGTDAWIYVDLVGKNGKHCNYAFVGGDDSSYLERGDLTIYNYPSLLSNHDPVADCKLIDDIEYAVIVNSNKDMEGNAGGNGWHLEYLAVEDKFLGKDVVFPVKRWFDETADDRKLTRKVYPSTNPDMTEYEIDVQTGRVQGAGTDARIKISLLGTETVRSIREFQPGDANNNFENGMFETFYLPGLDLGNLTQIELTNDGSGKNSEWFVETIVIRNSKTGKEWRFDVNSWVVKGKVVKATPTL